MKVSNKFLALTIFSLILVAGAFGQIGTAPTDRDTVASYTARAAALKVRMEAQATLIAAHNQATLDHNANQCAQNGHSASLNCSGFQAEADRLNQESNVINTESAALNQERADVIAEGAALTARLDAQAANLRKTISGDWNATVCSGDKVFRVVHLFINDKSLVLTTPDGTNYSSSYKDVGEVDHNIQVIYTREGVTISKDDSEGNKAGDVLLSGFWVLFLDSTHIGILHRQYNVTQNNKLLSGNALVAIAGTDLKAFTATDIPAKLCTLQNTQPSAEDFFKLAVKVQ